jgi:hypothetical protein
MLTRRVDQRAGRARAVRAYRLGIKDANTEERSNRRMPKPPPNVHLSQKGAQGLAALLTQHFHDDMSARLWGKNVGRGGGCG